MPETAPLLVLALIIVGGLLVGRLARRVALPGVTAQILLGVALGHSGLALFSPQSLAGLAPITQFALGLIAVSVGGHLNLRRLHGARKRLGLLLLAEVLITPLLVYCAVVLLVGASWRSGVLLAALCVATAPATVVAVIAERRARGVFTKTLLGAVALNNIACILLFGVAHMVARVGLENGPDPAAREYLLAPLRQLGASALLGGTMGVVLIALTRRVVRKEEMATASFVCVLLTAGLAGSAGLSPLLACLILGVTLANLTPDKDEIVESAYVNVREAVFAVFFTLAGMHLDLGALAMGGGLVAAVFLARLVGKVSAARVALGLAHATEKVRRHLGPALVPQAGVAVGMLLLVNDDPVMASVAPGLLAVGLAVVAVNELVGPILARRSIERAGEAGQDRDRILEFLHEENILVDLQAPTKEEAIARLVDVIARSHHLDAQRDELLASVLAREADGQTCVGEGLAVPHGTLPSGDRIVGAMGLSSAGLELPTPDGRPVHCMVVLASPAGERNRHLEVLASLAKAIGADPQRQHELYAAATPAHAYELLHADEAQDFNWFLED